MTKVFRLCTILVLAAVLFVVGAGSASALDADVNACWSNCGIGDSRTLQ